MINKPNNECETKRCLYDSATRTRFYNGMLLTEEHLRTEQEYHREALKRVNRNLFGSGIVCGLRVERQSNGLCIKVHPGVALDCCGNLIEVCNCITLDLAKECKDRYGTDCIPSTQSQNQNQFIITKYLVLRYKEQLSDPEPVLTTPDDCKPAGEKPGCEASKIREGYCIELWDECPCPEKYQEPEKSLLVTLQETRGTYQQPTNPTPPLPDPNQPQTPGGQGGQGGQTQVDLNQRQAAMRQQQQPDPASSLENKVECIELPLPCLSCGCCENTNAVGLAALKFDCKENTLEVEDCACRRYVISPRFLNWLLSRLQSVNYMPDEMKSVYQQLGHLPIAHAIATAVTFEGNSVTIKRHEERIKALEDRLANTDQEPRPSRRPARRPPVRPPARPGT